MGYRRPLTDEQRQRAYDLADKRTANWLAGKRGGRVADPLASQRITKADLVELFGGKCMDCNTIYPNHCFDFHHLENKQHGISQIMGGNGARLATELKKCVMLCANCHRIRHSKRYSKQFNTV